MDVMNEDEFYFEDDDEEYFNIMDEWTEPFLEQRIAHPGLCWFGCICNS